ncbi:molybdenum cofactor cytidylyltransferase [Reticulibacter mediterranei]|uniref:Molybdenum cofactor cytidylyltransferase n=1 Tax=Reticulibacter mediterranei TaxID=2778369 RepID=A0A8J3N1H5_9CHLR|nr:nucleotidyltransferase family protein [Reticulibacter mediterranei]GHO91322.1 molybdenum cofactor cytidylyltransferase [Reticulibacter mediterranei]
MPTQGTTAVIILAAGSSSRMSGGHHKLLLPLGGRPVLIHVLETALASQARPIILVLGHRADEIRSQVAAHIKQHDISIIENPDYQQGMSTSLHMGLQALTNIRDNNHQNADLPISTVILLGDQPLMTASIIDRLIATREASGKSIIVPLYHGKRGNPVLFAADLFPELMEVTGDEGAEALLCDTRRILPRLS